MVQTEIFIYHWNLKRVICTFLQQFESYNYDIFDGSKTILLHRRKNTWPYVQQNFYVSSELAKLVEKYSSGKSIVQQCSTSQVNSLDHTYLCKKLLHFYRDSRTNLQSRNLELIRKIFFDKSGKSSDNVRRFTIKFVGNVWRSSAILPLLGSRVLCFWRVFHRFELPAFVFISTFIRVILYFFPSFFMHITPLL